MENIEFGYVILSDEEEAKNIGVSTQTLKKYHRQLMKLGYLEIIESENKKIKKFNLKKLTGDKCYT